MRIFISYAHEDARLAEELAVRLQQEDHEVYFDRTSLQPGQGYDRELRALIRKAELMVFLVSPDSVETGRYTLSELRFARERWPNPNGKVLPVMARPTLPDQIPAFLAALGILEGHGNLPAEVVAEVAGLAASRRRRVSRLALSGAVLATGLLVVLSPLIPEPDAEQSLEESAEEGSRASEFVTSEILSEPNGHGDRRVTELEYEQQPSHPLWRDAVRPVELISVSIGRYEGKEATRIEIEVANHTEAAHAVSLGPNRFRLENQRGEELELLRFCCEATGESLAPGQTRRFELVYEGTPTSGAVSKESSIDASFVFKITGLLPVLRASWHVDNPSGITFAM